MAGRRYGIPVSGTHAHSWVLSFPSELEAFRAFAKSSPKNCPLLVDTYDVREGVENAIAVAREMEADGERLSGIRIDSGDLARLSAYARRLVDTYDVREGVENAIAVAREMEADGERLSGIRIDSGDLARLSAYARRRFDEEGLGYVKIVVSNDLDEHTITSLFNQGAPVDAVGVGTQHATSYDQPARGCVYNLSARRERSGAPWTPVMKFSERLRRGHQTRHLLRPAGPRLRVQALRSPRALRRPVDAGPGVLRAGL